MVFVYTLLRDLDVREVYILTLNDDFREYAHLEDFVVYMSWFSKSRWKTETNYDQTMLEHFTLANHYQRRREYSPQP